MKNTKNIGIFLGIILILISSFVVETKRKVPVRTIIVNCETLKIAENTMNIYAKHGYITIQLSPILVRINNPNYNKIVEELDVTNNYILIMQK